MVTSGERRAGQGREAPRDPLPQLCPQLANFFRRFQPNHPEYPAPPQQKKPMVLRPLLGVAKHIGPNLSIEPEFQGVRRTTFGRRQSVLLRNVHKQVKLDKRSGSSLLSQRFGSSLRRARCRLPHLTQR